jgi:hypothetical protein
MACSLRSAAFCAALIMSALATKRRLNSTNANALTTKHSIIENPERR